MIRRRSTSTSDQILGKTNPLIKPINPTSHDTMKQWPLEEKKFWCSVQRKEDEDQTTTM
jgi:hypothetical protein